MNEPILTLVGNLAGDPELRFTTSGIAVCKLRMAQTPRDKTPANEWVDGEPWWQDVTCWREMAENVAETLHRGDRVVVTGRMKQREYEAKDGTKRRVHELEADAVGPDLRYAQAKISKVARSGGGTADRPATTRERPAAAPSAETQRTAQATQVDDEPPW